MAVKCGKCGKSLKVYCRICGAPGTEGREICSKHLKEILELHERILAGRLPDDELADQHLAARFYGASERVVRGDDPPRIDTCPDCERQERLKRWPHLAEATPKEAESRLSKDEMSRLDIDARRRGWR